VNCFDTPSESTTVVLWYKFEGKPNEVYKPAQVCIPSPILISPVSIAKQGSPTGITSTQDSH
jgi:hypothetical protein